MGNMEHIGRQSQTDRQGTVVLYVINYEMVHNTSAILLRAATSFGGLALAHEKGGHAAYDFGLRILVLLS